MNQQNKLAGRAFATVGLVEESFNGELKYVIAHDGMLWRLNPDTLLENGLNIDIFDDLITQLQAIGGIEYLRYAMGMQDFSGPTRGPVIKHSERPDVTAMVTVLSGPRTGYNPNVYNYQYDIMLDCFIDLDNLNAAESRPLENEINFMGALINGGMCQPVEAATEIAAQEGRIPIQHPLEESADFYKSLCEGTIDKKQIKYVQKAIEKVFKRNGITDFTIKPTKKGNINIVFVEEDIAELATDILVSYGLPDIYNSGDKDIFIPYENIVDFAAGQ